MNNSFYRFPQNRFWYELRDHLSALAGVAVTSIIDDPVIGSWLDFTFRGHQFTIDVEDGEFVFFVADTDCPESVSSEVATHFKSLWADQTDHGDAGDITW